MVTSNGKPVGILSPTDEEHLEEALAELRRARAAAAVGRLQRAATMAGGDGLSQEEIDAEIERARRARPA